MQRLILSSCEVGQLHGKVHWNQCLQHLKTEERVGHIGLAGLSFGGVHVLRQRSFGHQVRRPFRLRTKID